VQGRGIVEDQLHIQVEEISEADIERLSDTVFMGFEHIHGPVEMVQIERVCSCNADILAQPLLITLKIDTLWLQRL